MDGWTGRDGTGRDGTGRDGTGRDGTGRDGTGRDGTGRDGTFLFSYDIAFRVFLSRKFYLYSWNCRLDNNCPKFNAFKLLKAEKISLLQRWLRHWVFYTTLLQCLRILSENVIILPIFLSKTALD